MPKIGKHTDRCCNPYKLQSKDSNLKRKNHSGNLRVISKSFRVKFPNLPEDSRICDKCRLLNNNSLSSESSFENSTSMEHECEAELLSQSQFPSEKILDSSITSGSDNSLLMDKQDKNNLPSKREIELEKILSDLKDKFSSLRSNDPFRLSILTKLPETWSDRKIAEEFKCSRRLAKKSKKLRSAKGVLAQPASKAGKKVSDSTVEKVIQFYNSDKISRVMAGVKNLYLSKLMVFVHTFKSDSYSLI